MIDIPLELDPSRPNEYRLAVTGHRPDKLQVDGEAPYDGRAYATLCRFAERELAMVRDMVRGRSPSRFVIITGMALGWDQAIAEVSYSFGLPYEAFIPFPGFDQRWPKSSRRRYEGLLSFASRVVYVSDGDYAAWKMMKRNEAMVDYALEATGKGLMALWNGSAGGTCNTVRYARRHGLVVGNLWQKWLAFTRQ